MKDKLDYENYKETSKERKVSLEYVQEIYGISICDCFLGGKSSGTRVACVWNGEKFENLKIL